MFLKINLIFILVSSLLVSNQTSAQWTNSSNINLGKVYALTQDDNENYLLSIGGVYKMGENSQWIKQTPLPAELKKSLKAYSLYSAPISFQNQTDFLFIKLADANNKVAYSVDKSTWEIKKVDFTEIRSRWDTNIVAYSPVFESHKDFIYAAFFTYDSNQAIDNFFISKKVFNDTLWEDVVIKKNVNLATFTYRHRNLTSIRDKLYLLGDSIGCLDSENKNVSSCLTMLGFPPLTTLKNLHPFHSGFISYYSTSPSGQNNALEVYEFNGFKWTEIAENAYVNSGIDSSFFMGPLFMNDSIGLFGNVNIRADDYRFHYRPYKYLKGSMSWQQENLNLPVGLNFITGMSQRNQENLIGTSHFGPLKIDLVKGTKENLSLGLNHGEFIDIATIKGNLNLFGEIGVSALKPMVTNDDYFNNRLQTKSVQKVFKLKNGVVVLGGNSPIRKKLYSSINGNSYQEVNSQYIYGLGGPDYVLFDEFNGSNFLFQCSRQNSSEPVKMEFSNDFGVSWVEMKGGFPGFYQYFSDLFDAKFILQNDSLFLFNNDSVHFSVNFGETWTALPTVSKPNNIQNVFFYYQRKPTLVNKLFNFKNRGDYELLSWDYVNKVWHNVDTLPTNPLGMETLDLPATFVYNDSVVFVKHDTGKIWLEVSKGLPNENIYITGMARLRDSLYLSTDGFGVYSMAISDVPGFKKDTINTSVPLPEFSFSHYPNPVDEILQITLGTTHTGVDIKLLNLQGITLISQSIPGRQTQSTINTQNLQAGVYILQLTQPNGKSHVRKIVVK